MGLVAISVKSPQRTYAAPWVRTYKHRNQETIALSTRMSGLSQIRDDKDFDLVMIV